MFSHTIRGLFAGILGGILLGCFMQAIVYHTHHHGDVAMIMLIAGIVHWDNPIAGWIWHLANSAFIGAIFGALADDRITHSYKLSIAWGCVYGALWWILGELIMMPLFLGFHPFNPVILKSFKLQSALGLAGHLCFGISLGAAYVWLSLPHPMRALQQVRMRPGYNAQKSHR